MLEIMQLRGKRPVLVFEIKATVSRLLISPTTASRAVRRLVIRVYRVEWQRGGSNRTRGVVSGGVLVVIMFGRG